MALTQRGNIQRVSQIAQNSTKMQTTTAPPSRSYMHRMILFPILFVAVILFVFVFKMQMTTAPPSRSYMHQMIFFPFVLLAVI